MGMLPLLECRTVVTSGLTARAVRLRDDKSSLRNAYLLMSYEEVCDDEWDAEEEGQGASQ
jgi:hypothetical protein